jgi:hypothetical protein
MKEMELKVSHKLFFKQNVWCYSATHILRVGTLEFSSFIRNINNVLTTNSNFGKVC